MQGAGNDFVIVDNRKYQFRLNELVQLAPMLCNRKFGIGADGLLTLNDPQTDGLDYTMIYRNADGSDAGMCGNGARCLALFAYAEGFGEQQKFNMHENVYRAQINSGSEAEITFPVTTKIEEITLDGQLLIKVNAGTEHAVKQVVKQELENENTLKSEGRYLRRHEYFHPVGTNVSFICGESENSLFMQTYERGVENLTLACGTGAIASALAWHHLQQKKQKKNEFNIKTKGGNLSVTFLFDPSTSTYSGIKLKGPAHFVFEGTYYL